MYRLEISNSGFEQGGLVRSLGVGIFCIGSAADSDIVVAGLDPIHARLELDGARVWVAPGPGHSKLLVNGQPVTGRLEVSLPLRLELGGIVVASLRHSEVEKDGAPGVGNASLGAVGGEEVGDQTMRILPNWGAAQQEDVSLSSRRRRVLPEVVLGEEREVTQTVFFDMKPLVVEVDRTAGVRMDYALREEIARGGMGRIFAAADPLLGREVAVKVSTVQTEGGEAQFAREAKVLADLAHPNIVPVHAMGVNPQGLPFYSMKLVKGKTLQAIIRELAAKNRDTMERFRLERLLMVFRKVCDAVEFAHAKGFLHRDLKPENVMVGEFGEVLVMDWGLAQPLRGNSWGAGMEDAGSEEAQVCIEGTPQYMSPEQAQALPLDERSDVYSLGAVLYAILALRAPVQGRTLEEVLRRVRGGDVTPMSTRLVSSKVEKEPPTEFVAEMHRGIPDALRAVTFKAMARDPGERYQSVSELVADVEAYLNGFATEAENANWARQFFLWMRRHPGVSVLFLLLVLSAGGFTVRLSASERKALSSAEEARSNARTANENALEAKENAQRAERNAREAEQNAQTAQNNAREADLNARKAQEERDRARREAARAQIALAEAAERDLNADAMGRVLQAVPADLRSQEWEFLTSRANSEWRTYRPKGGGAWRAVTPHPVEAGIVLCVESDGSLVRLDLNTGEFRSVAPLDRPPSRVRFHNFRLPVSPDGTLFAVCREFPQTTASEDSHDYQIEIYSFKDPREPLVVKRQRRGGILPIDLQFNRHGDFLLGVPVSEAKDGVFMLDARTGACLWERSGDGICAATFSGTTSVVLLYSQFNGVLTLPAASGVPLPVKEDPLVPQDIKKAKITWSNADVLRVAFTNEPNELLLFQGDTWRKVDIKVGRTVFSQRIKNGQDGKIAHVSGEDSFLTVSPRGERAGVLQEWDMRGGGLMRSTLMELDYQSGNRSTLGLFKHPVSKEVGVIRGGRLKVWKPIPDLLAVSKLYTSAVWFSFKPGVLVHQLPFSPGKPFRFGLLDTGMNGGTIIHERVIEDGAEGFVDVRGRVSLDGRKIRFQCRRNSGEWVQRFFRISDDLRIEDAASAGLDGAMSFSASGSAGCNNTTVFDAVSGKKVSTLEPAGILNHMEEVGWVGEERIVQICQVRETDESTVADSARAVLLWSAKDGRLLAKEITPEASVLASSPDGSLIAEAGSDMKVRIRNGFTLEEEKQYRLHDGPITALAWHPTRPILATLASDYTIKIFDLGKERILYTLSQRLGGGARVAWSPDGATLRVSSMHGHSLYVPKFEPQ